MSTTTARTPPGELIRLAALRNCEGASHLAEDELEEAIASFTLAYHCIGKAASQGDEDQEVAATSSQASTDNDDGDDSDADNDDDEDPASIIPDESVDKYHFILDTTDVAWYSASRRQGNDEDAGSRHTHSRALDQRRHQTVRHPDCYYVYNEALIFPPESATDPQEMSFFEAVVLFNMALTFHRQHERIQQSSSTGLPGSSSPEDNAVRGLVCYNQCLARMKEGAYDHSTDATMANMIVEAHMLIACLNNKIQVLVALGDYHEAFWILQEFGSVLTATTGDPPGFEAAETRGLEATLELLNTPEFTAVHESELAASEAAAAAAAAASAPNANANPSIPPVAAT